MSVENLAERMRSDLMRYAGLNYTVKFVFDEGGVLFLDGTVTPPVLSEADEDADCTLRLSLDNAEKLIDGQLNPTLAYTMGRLKVDGSVGVALKLASMMED